MNNAFRKRIILLVISLVVGGAVLAGTLLYEKTIYSRAIRPTPEWTDEQILTLPYFELVAVADENRNLPCDVKSYSVGDGIIHLILPESVPENSVVVYVKDAEENIVARRVYDFTQKVMIGPWEVVLEHHTLPTLFFETDDPKVYEAMNATREKDIICDGSMLVYENKERFLSTESSGLRASIHGRGHSSWRNVAAKKSYSLSFDKPTNLLGLGKNRSWNLIGNGFDHSLIKNLSFNDLSTAMGIKYQPRMQNINLYVDGKYQGVYTLTTKMTVDNDRIALKHGDYLYRLDPNEPENPILYTSTAWVEDHEPYYPVADLIYPEAEDFDKTEATAILQQFIDLRDNPAVPGLSDVCDLDNLARFYWIEEISMNFDANSASIYFYYDSSDSKIRFGPVWDMDLTLGVIDYKEDILFNEPTGWKIRELGIYKVLFERPEFVAAVNDVYYNGGIRDLMLSGDSRFEAWKETMGEDGNTNFTLFGHVTQSHLDYPYGDTYDEYAKGVIDFYRTRVRWIDEQMEK